MNSVELMMPQIQKITPEQNSRLAPKVLPGEEFQSTLEKLLGDNNSKILDQKELPRSIKFSSHASQRIRERNIQISPSLVQDLERAFFQMNAKGVEDGVILTPQATLIVNVPNRTVVTALDRSMSQGNVFTNIDGAVVLGS